MNNFLILSLVLFCQMAFSQVDSTIFQSEFEKQTLQSFIDSEPTNSMDLFLCINASNAEKISFEKELNKHITGIQPTISGKSIKKQIKTIYTSTHQHFLKKYDEKAYFTDIFRNGTYNCVSATALYALILDRFHIDYIIKETPEHVYIVADPTGNQILMESTRPTNGTVLFNDKYKQSYVTYLKENKIISDLEYQNQSVDVLFEKYYDDNKTISLNELVGIQYSNDGIFEFDKLNFKKAAISFEKAYLFYPSKTIKFSYHTSLIYLMNEDDKTKVYSGITLAKFMNINVGAGVTGTVAEDYFNLMINEYVINHPNLSLFERFYIDLKEFTTDSVNLDQIDRTYYYYLGYSCFANQKYVEALAALKISYDLNPENINTKQLIQEVAAKHIMKDRNRASELDSLKQYFDVFPFLFEVDAFQNYTTYCYLRIISESINRSDKASALIYLDEFEELVRSKPNIALNENYVTGAYGEIASYYIRKSNYDEAENYFMKGIELAPNSYELKEGLKTLMDVKTDLNSYIIANKNSSNSYRSIPGSTNSNTNTSFKDEIDKYLPGTWVATALIINGKEEKVPSSEKMVLIFQKNKKMTIDEGGTKENIRWAIRSNGKLLYWVYSETKTDYDVFKVLELNANTLKLQPYEDDKISDEIVIFTSQ